MHEFCTGEGCLFVYVIPINATFPPLFFTLLNFVEQETFKLTILLSEHLGRIKITFWCYFFHFSSQLNKCSQSRAQLSYFLLKLSRCLLVCCYHLVLSPQYSLTPWKGKGKLEADSKARQTGVGALEADGPGPCGPESTT